MVEMQASRIANLDATCRALFKEKGRLYLRKEKYKATSEWLDGEITLLIDEGVDFNCRFAQRTSNILGRLEEAINISQGGPIEQHLQATKAQVDAWIKEEAGRYASFRGRVLTHGENRIANPIWWGRFQRGGYNMVRRGATMPLGSS
jgi:hypothetical protein